VANNAWTYSKTHRLIGGESSVEIAGVLPVADTLYGRLRPSGTMSATRAAAPGRGELGRHPPVVPAHDLYRFQASADVADATYRSIENGTSLSGQPATACGRYVRVTGLPPRNPNSTTVHSHRPGKNTRVPHESQVVLGRPVTLTMTADHLLRRVNGSRSATRAVPRRRQRPSSSASTACPSSMSFLMTGLSASSTRAAYRESRR
jgi:hypothetical protein